MIAADARGAFDALEARLERQAASLAEARARDTLLARQQDVRSWRHSGLLWPLFGKG
ncbi:MAG: hypothetical protein ABIT04_05895 [Novosphingobium sp.]